MKITTDTMIQDGIKGYLVSVPAFGEYAALKSYFCSQWQAETLWPEQYEKHLKERELFEKYNIKYAFISENFATIAIAGNSIFAPLGKLAGKVQIVNNSVVSCKRIVRYAQVQKEMAKERSRVADGGCWFYSRLANAHVQATANFLEACGFTLVVEADTVGHNVVSVNTISKFAIFGEKKYLGLGQAAICKGQELTPDQLVEQLCLANNISNAQCAEMQAKQASVKVLPSVVVNCDSHFDANAGGAKTAVEKCGTKEKNLGITQRLRAAGLDYKGIPSLSANHNKIFVDFHYKVARCGVHVDDLQYEISESQLLQLLGTIC